MQRWNPELFAELLKSTTLSTGAPTGACIQQKGRAVFNVDDRSSPSPLLEQENAMNPPSPDRQTPDRKSLSYSARSAINYRAHAHLTTILPAGPIRVDVALFPLK